MTLRSAVVAATIVAFAPTAFAHGDAKRERKTARPISTEQTPFGREGDPKNVSRAVNVDRSDQMRFSPAELTIKQGETAHVAPGKTGTMVWQFTKPGEFHYGCLVPGHFEAGMIGKVVVTK